MKAKILPMGEADLDAVHAIENRVYSQPWTVNLFRGELNQPDKRIYLVAKVGDRVIGYGGIMFIDSEAHLTTIAVDTAFQGKGVGSMITLRLVELAILKRVHWLTLEARASNTAAIGLYEKFGFKKIGERPGYYADGENAAIMWTNDIQGDEYKTLIQNIKTGV
jgi:ribosomal-protein-alanine N-acetyltransferase